MARASRSTTAQTADIRHSDTRINNPRAAIAGAGSVPLAPKFALSRNCFTNPFLANAKKSAMARK